MNSHPYALRTHWYEFPFKQNVNDRYDDVVKLYFTIIDAKPEEAWKVEEKEWTGRNEKHMKIMPHERWPLATYVGR